MRVRAPLRDRKGDALTQSNNRAGVLRHPLPPCLGGTPPYPVWAPRGVCLKPQSVPNPTPLSRGSSLEAPVQTVQSDAVEQSKNGTKSLFCFYINLPQLPLWFGVLLSGLWSITWSSVVAVFNNMIFSACCCQSSCILTVIFLALHCLIIWTNRF